jgi:site-specific DNA-methyltransferase (adenine-specific)
MDAVNKLYFGDNLKILREYVADASVDLIYLDPPFNSSATYPSADGLFKEKTMQTSRVRMADSVAILSDFRYNSETG